MVLSFTRVWTWSVIHYHQLSCSLDVFNFNMIADESFCRLYERMIVFRSAGFAKKQAQTEIATIKISSNVSYSSYSSPGRPQDLQLATSWLKISNTTEMTDFSARYTCLELRDLITCFSQLSSTIMNRLCANMTVNNSEWKLKLSSTILNYHDRLNGALVSVFGYLIPLFLQIFFNYRKKRR